MSTKPIREITLESFSIYGFFGSLLNPSGPKLGAPPITFYRDMVPVDLGLATTVYLSSLVVEKRPPIVDVSEFHMSCGEGMVPLDGDALIHVAPAGGAEQPAPEEIEIFRVPKGMAVSLRPGVWHHAPFACGNDTLHALILLPERIYARDCIVKNLEPSCQVSIEGA